MLADVLGELYLEEFLARVESSRRSGIPRLVFAIDHLTDALRRVIKLATSRWTTPKSSGLTCASSRAREPTPVPNELGRTTAEQGEEKSRKACGTYAEDQESADWAVQQGDALLVIMGVTNRCAHP